MDARPKTSAVAAKTLLLGFALFVVTIFFMNHALPPSVAQSQDEREVEYKIPKHVPIKVKIRSEKEKAFKDLKNQKWHRDFELEVTNTSNKPIYFLELWLELPEIASENGGKVGIPLRYGRMEFVHLNTLAIPEDIAIQPGEVYTFNILDNYRRGWEAHNARENRQDPTRIQITFVQLSFGDGTGFNGSDAKPYPYKRDQFSTNPRSEGTRALARFFASA
jgi:hypothetical protein